jgi:gliding motility-associated-like protein
MTKKLSGTENGLIGYWTFDETSGSLLTDKSPNKFHGTVKGGQRIFSGAPIGDESTLIYASNWTNVKLVLGNFSMENISGSPAGAHLYKVNHAPSQVGGLPGTSSEYYGAFVADLSVGQTFSLKQGGAQVCPSFKRVDNSKATWIPATSLTGIPDRIELTPAAAGTSFSLDLGPDKILCDQVGFTIRANLADASGKSFLWSTGEVSSSINVSQSGKYFVTVSQGCVFKRDTIQISFLKTPAPFSLGKDEVSCEIVPRKLQAPIGDFKFTWQDGSNKNFYDVKDFGVYWLTIENICGKFTDSITFAKPAFAGQSFDLELGSNIIQCDKSSAIIQTNLSDASGKSFLWSTGEVSSSINVSQSGKYFVKVSQGCVFKSDTIQISFLKTPAPFSLGIDEVICEMAPRKLQPPNGDFKFIWQDGSSGNFYDVKDYGVYWLTIENACGQFTDSVRFTRPSKDDIIFPNVITPNGDELNQFFMIEPITPRLNLIVYNRWGKSVYESVDYRNDWDGFELPAGIYFYTIFLPCAGDKKGVISLIR